MNRKLPFFILFIIVSLSVLAQRQLPFRIGPYEKKQFNDCIEKGRPRCYLDTCEYSGISGEFNFFTGWALGKYRKSGNRGGGIGFGISVAYQPVNRLPLSIHGDFGMLYTDIRNENAILPILPLNGNGAVIPFPVKTNIKNELILGNIGVRYWLPTRYWQPYGMAGIGFINHNTLLRLYDDDQWPVLGTSDEGLLLESRIRHKWYGSKYIAAGISWNAAYSLNLDFRFTLIHSQKFRHQSLKLPDDWGVFYSSENGNGLPDKIEANSNDLFNTSKSVPFRMLLFSFSLTAFFE
jgi:hypothetical protein